MKADRRYVTVAALACLAGLFMAQPAWAQSGSDILPLVELVTDIQKALYGFLMFFIIAGSAGALGFSIYHIVSGKPEEARRFIWVFVALAIGAVLLRILSGVAPNGMEGKGFVYVLGKAMESVLISVAMISMTSIIIKMMQGDEDSYRRLYMWLLGLIAGITIFESFVARLGDSF